MAMTLTDGRGELYQWDTGRTLTVDDATVTQVHFQNRAYGRTIDVDVKDGTAIIPDELLQKAGELRVYAFSGTAESGFTKVERVFNIVRRNKPNDYMFTPTEQKSLEGLQKQIGDLSDLKTDAKTDIVAAINETATAGQTLGLTGAIVGQVPTVKSVDGNGVPTEWEAGDSKPFVVTVTYGDNDTLTADKTHAEIVEAYAAGAQINAKIVNYPGLNAPIILPLFLNNSDLVFAFSGSGVQDGSAMAMTAQDFNGSWSVSLTELATLRDIPSGGTDTSLGITGASAGQVPIVNSVDVNGAPNGWGVQTLSVLSATAQTLIVRLLESAVYVSDQSGNIEALKTIFGNTNAETFTVTQNLDNVYSDNNANTIIGSNAYIATLTAADGYQLDSVTITMGGADVTATVYSNGSINIPAVTGNIIISAVAVVVTAWDYEWTADSGVAPIDYSTGVVSTTGEWVDGLWRVTSDLGIITGQAMEVEIVCKILAVESSCLTPSFSFVYSEGCGFKIYCGTGDRIFCSIGGSNADLNVAFPTGDDLQTVHAIASADGCSFEFAGLNMSGAGVTNNQYLLKSSIGISSESTIANLQIKELRYRRIA